RWGALVVLPGRESVRAWTPGGIAAGAAPSFELLLSLFDPDSPGHGGAALIEGGKVARFAVRLPLSTSDRLPERLGTRHHAAMGLSEVTDALVVAVSEERGTVSAFRDGEIQVVAAKGDLAAVIREHWHGTLDEKRRNGAPRRWAPLWEVLGSLLLATAFWSTVVMSRIETREMVLTVPVQYVGLSPSLAFEGERPAQAKIEVAGPTGGPHLRVPGHGPHRHPGGRGREPGRLGPPADRPR
ncbi:MAG: DNA integrity scanning protein DisA nucleotide-binding domain protein, partial [Proteobacteria bacterium]|nr:DNA integrity scanning protein DisA nucleotide-binding domain protein [Pseudomonadota bacterium]